MPPPPESITVHEAFFRHDRWYCIFSVEGREEEFLYYSHRDRPLRSLMFGNTFRARLPGLLEREDLCIECGLGLQIAGGVALDDGDIIAWNCTIVDANKILASLIVVCKDCETFITAFEEKPAFPL